jgi:Leucine-rich repeat (LRR) protein
MFEKLIMFTINSLEKLLEIPKEKYGYICEINIQGCDCSNFPEIIFEFFNLEVLDISHTKIDFLPDEFNKLQNLKELIFDSTTISILPKSISKCKELNYISLSETKIKLLPSWFCKLPKLENLYLPKCNLNSIKFDITKIYSVVISINSYNNYDNISDDCEYLQFNNLDVPINNLPINLKKIKLVNPKEPIDVKVPFDCELIIS